MKANVVHGDYNPCGGAERLSLITLRSLLEAGIDFDITTLKGPDMLKLENSFGKNLVSVMESAKGVYVINLFQELLHQQQGEHEDYYNYDVTINTNGDAAPYYRPSFSKDNAITYCHYPSTKYHIEFENVEYLRTDLGMTGDTIGYSNERNYSDINNSNNRKANLQFSRKREYFEVLKYGYWNLMKNSIVITNSDFSRRAIVNALGLKDVRILNPPIDIETFRNHASMTNVVDDGDDDRRQDIIIVISRIAPHKKIENAIKVAKILKDNNIGRGMKIVGNLYTYFLDYYSDLKQMVIDLSLNDYITFEVNASLDKLLSIVQESRVFFHPMVGEHFGMSVIEAMAAGLIAVVPNEGGVTEFVPRKYQYSTIQQAAEIIMNVFNNVHKTDRIEIIRDIDKFSNSHYIKGFHTILKELVLPRRPVKIR
jgi:glycosyltransferase involved in cell wall biosynthesis